MLVARDLSKEYRSGENRLAVLRDVSFSIPQGAFVAIVGPSGSGKTTLLGLLAGLDTPTRGQVLLDDADLTAMDEDQRARLRGEKVGFVFQSFQLISDAHRARERAGAARAARRARRGASARASCSTRVGLGDRLDHFPTQLSGGEQQRVAIARAFANAPRILFADEPTGNLDSDTGARIVELLEALNRESKTTIILVTHDLALAGARAAHHSPERRPRRLRHRDRAGGLRSRRAQRGSSFALAWRESRTARRRLLLYMSSISLGVAALVAIDSFSENVIRSVHEQSRALLGGDVCVDAQRAAHASGRLAARLAATRTASRRRRRRTSSSMALVPRTRRHAPRAGARRRAGLSVLRQDHHRARRRRGARSSRATTSSSIRRSSSRSTRRSATRCRSATRSSSSQERSRAFRATSASRAAIGPRVYIPERYVAETGLLVFGSRAEYETLFKLPATTRRETCSSRASRKRLSARHERLDARARATTNRGSRARSINCTTISAIVGLVALLLGGIGVASGVHAFVDAEDRPGRDSPLPRRDELAGAGDLHGAGRGDGIHRRARRRRARRRHSVRDAVRAQGFPAGRRRSAARAVGDSARTRRSACGSRCCSRCGRSSRCAACRRCRRCGASPTPTRCAARGGIRFASLLSFAIAASVLELGLSRANTVQRGIGFTRRDRRARSAFCGSSAVGAVVGRATRASPVVAVPAAPGRREPLSPGQSDARRRARARLRRVPHGHAVSGAAQHSSLARPPAGRGARERRVLRRAGGAARRASTRSFARRATS